MGALTPVFKFYGQFVHFYGICTLSIHIFIFSLSLYLSPYSPSSPILSLSARRLSPVLSLFRWNVGNMICLSAEFPYQRDLRSEAGLKVIFHGRIRRCYCHGQARKEAKRGGGQGQAQRTGQGQGIDSVPGLWQSAFRQNFKASDKTLGIFWFLPLKTQYDQGLCPSGSSVWFQSTKTFQSTQ